MEVKFDKSAALANLDDDGELLAELIEIFVEDCAKCRQEINQAMETSDAALLRRAAHTIKGSLDVFSANAAREAAQHVETIASESRLSDAAAAITLMDRELDLLIPELQEFLTQ